MKSKLAVKHLREVHNKVKGGKVMTEKILKYINTELNKLGVYDIYWNDVEVLLVCKRTTEVLEEFRGKVFARLDLDKLSDLVDKVTGDDRN